MYIKMKDMKHLQEALGNNSSSIGDGGISFSLALTALSVMHKLYLKLELVVL
jgi:hypothetical protein